MNILTVSGRIFKDAEVRAVGDQSVVSFTILNKDKRTKNKETGKWESVACFVNCEYWTKFPQKQIQEIVKDSWVSATGRLEQSTWGEGADKKSKYVLNIPSFNYPEMLVNPFETKANQSTNKPPVQATPTQTFNNPPVQNRGQYNNQAPAPAQQVRQQGNQYQQQPQGQQFDDNNIPF